LSFISLDHISIHVHNCLAQLSEGLNTNPFEKMYAYLGIFRNFKGYPRKSRLGDGLLIKRLIQQLFEDLGVILRREALKELRRRRAVMPQWRGLLSYDVPWACFAVSSIHF